MNRSKDEILEQLTIQKKEVEEKIKIFLKEQVHGCMMEAIRTLIPKISNGFSRRGNIERDLASRATTNESEVHLNGIDFICDDNLMAWSLFVWTCDRMAKDLSNYWGSNNSDSCSILSILLFVIRKKEGLAPFKTHLGQQLGIQARDLVWRLMWITRRRHASDGRNTRCTNWLFSFVPICRKSYTTLSGGISEISPGSENADTSVKNDYKDLSNADLAWRQEATYFRQSVDAGCKMMEESRIKLSPKKHPRVNMTGFLSDESETQAYKDDFSFISVAADEIRKTFSIMLSETRHKARCTFFDLLGFMLSQIDKLGVDEVNRKGLNIEIENMNNNGLMIHSNEMHLKREIPLSSLRDSADILETDNENAKKLREMIQKYPSFSVRWKYKLQVEEGNRANSCLETISEEEGIQGMLHEFEKISLHHLSLNVLTTICRATDKNAFLGSIKHSFLAVYMSSLAFRGLILQTLCKPCTHLKNLLWGCNTVAGIGNYRSIEEVNSSVVVKSNDGYDIIY